jgi:hypothetical protein
MPVAILTTGLRCFRFPRAGAALRAAVAEKFLGNSFFTGPLTKRKKSYV